MFAKDHEKHAQQINEEKECDMKSTSTKTSVETTIIPRHHAKERSECYLQHSSLSHETEIDEGGTCDDSREEHNAGHNDIKKLDGGESKDNIAMISNLKQSTISDEDDTSSLTGNQSTMLRSKSFISLAPNNEKNQVTKAKSKSKQYSSSIVAAT